MYKFDRKVWNHRVRKTVIVSLLAPLFSAFMGITAPSANATFVTASDGTCIQDVGVATGITVTKVGSDCLVTFNAPSNTTTTHTWIVPSNGSNFQILVVGGGGGGGGDGGNGGGGGELRYGSAASAWVPAAGTELTLQVGAGGAAGSHTPSSASGPGILSRVSWGGSARFTANPGAGGGGWTSAVVATGGSGGSGGTGTNGESATAVQSGCGSLSATQNNTAGKWYTGRWFLNGGSGAGTALTTTAPKNSITGSDQFYGGAGGGGWGGSINSNPTGPIYGLAGGGTVDNVSTSGGRGANWLYIPGDNHTTSWSGASAGAQGVDATGGGGGGGNACDPTINGVATTNGSTKRTAGGRGGSGVIVIRYTPLIFTVSFDANGGSGSPSATSVSQTPTSNSVTLTSVGSLNRSGYRFVGWNTAADGKGTDYAAGSTFTPSGNLTLYAKWNSTISYNGNTANSTRTIESTTVINTGPVTLSNGKLAQGSIVTSGLLFNMNAADSSSVVGSTWYDANRNGTTATAFGSPTYNSAEGYFQLNGTNQYLNMGSAVLPASNTTAFTASVMFKTDKPNLTDQAIMAKYVDGSTYNGNFIIRTADNAKIGGWRPSYSQLLTPKSFDEGNINYATVTYDGTNYALYLNGVLQQTVVTGSAGTTVTDLILGARGYGATIGQYFQGRIYSAQGYSKALTAAEILQNYNALLPNQFVSKTNYTLGQWNTLSNGTGTQYESNTVVDLDALKTPYLRLKPENYSVSGSTKTWSATNGASITDGAGATIIKGSPVLNMNGGGSFGASATFPTLSGDTSAGIKFGNADLPAYTFCGVARYKGTSTSLLGTARRIFASTSLDWITGFYQDGMGANHHHNGWVTTYVTTTLDASWHFFCDSGNRTMWDGVHYPTETYRATSYLPSMTINYGYEGQTSDWEVAEIVIYDEYLPTNQINQISRYFENRYGLSRGDTFTAASLITPVTNYTATGDATLQAQWYSTITYDGNGQYTGRAPSTHVIKSTTGTLATNSGNLVKANHKLVGWNTAADGSGTQYALGATYPNLGNVLLYARWARDITFPQAIIDPNILKPYSRFKASDYVSGTTWLDSSGNGRNATISGTNPTLITTTASVSNGNTTSFKALDGVPATKILFNNPYMGDGNYTLFHVARYDTGTNRRIFNSANNDNWLSGFFNGLSGVKHYGAWLTPESNRYSAKWVMSSDFGRGYRSNGEYSVTSTTGVDDFGPLAVNGDPYGQTSDFNIAEVIIYDRKLTLDEMRLVEDYLANTYGIVGYTNYGTYLTTSTLPVAATIGGRSDTFTATNGFGNKSFAISPVVSGITLDTSTANAVAVIVSGLVPAGTYVETITATDQAGYTASHIITITVAEAVRWSASNPTALVTTIGKSLSQRLDITGGMSGKVATLRKPTTIPLGGISIDTSTLVSSSFITLNVGADVLPGTYSLALSVTDDTKRVSNQNVSVTINNLPSLAFTQGTNDTTTTVTQNGLWLQYEIGKSWSGTGTSMVDLAGNNTAGSITANTTYSSSLGGGSASLNGSNMIWLNTGTILSTDSLSKFYWIYPTSATGTLVKTCDAGCNYHESELEMLNGKLYARVWALSPVSTNETITINAWHYVGYVYDRASGNTFIYVDGRLAGSIANSGTRGPPSTTQYDGISIGDSTYMATSSNLAMSFGAAHYYKRALSATEVFNNFAASAPRYFGTTFPGLALSGTSSITTTQGVSKSYPVFTASSGTGNKILGISPGSTGITIDTSTANSAILNIASTVSATSSTVARVFTETVTAVDSMSAITNYRLSITVNPPITITPTIPNTVTTTFGIAAYDTFTAAYGTGSYTFSNTASSYQSAFTLLKTSASAGVLTIANNLPAGTYIDTVTVTDAAGAVTSYPLTVIVNPGMTLTGSPSNLISTTIGKSASLRVNVANGTGARTMTITSPNSGITLDSSTITSANYVNINISSAVPANTFLVVLNVRDSLGSTRSETFTVIVNKAPKISSNGVVTNGLAYNFDAGNSASYSGTGTTWSSTVGARSLTLLGTSGLPTYSSDSGGYLDFNKTSVATQKHYAAGAIDTPTFTSFSVEAWAKFAAWPTSDVNGLVSDKYISKVNYQLFYGSIANTTNCSGTAGLHISLYDGAWKCSKAVTGLSLNTWYHIVGTYDSNSGFKMYLNGVLQSGATAAYTGNAQSDSSNRELYIAKRHNTTTDFFPGSIPVVRIYNRAISESEASQNFSAIANRFMVASSGTDSITVTEGKAASLNVETASDGTGTKTFTNSKTLSGITLDTSTANSFTLNIANTVTATNPTTSRIIYETVTATDAALATTTKVYAITINPPVQETATAMSISTTSGVAAYDTFTATYGTGNKTFSLTGSPTTSGFTLTQANNVAVLKVEPTVNPGTYYETVTATDTLGATKSLMITVVVAPPPTILGISRIESTKGVSLTSPIFSVTGGTGTLTMSLANSPSNSNITLTGVTSAGGYLLVGASSETGTYLSTLRVTDARGSYSELVVTIVVNAPVTLSGSLSITKTYGTSATSGYSTNGSGTAPFSFSSTPICAVVRTISGSYTYERINGTDQCTWTAPVGVSAIDALLVGAGGGGGPDGGAGGGGGSINTLSSVSLPASRQLSVQVGAGGTGGVWGGSNAAPGGTTSVTSGSTIYTAPGGSEGSGCGAASAAGGTAGSGGTAVAGGNGGYGATGSTCGDGRGSAGSDGPASSFTGSSTNYGGGGGGGPYPSGGLTYGPTAGGAGGGGAGTVSTGFPIQGLAQYFRSFPSTPTSAVSKEAFTTGTCGALIGNINYSTDSEFPCAEKENFQGYATGYFIAPVSGNYEFFLYSDDSSALAINVNGTERGMSKASASNTYLSSGSISSFVAGAAYPINVYFTEISGLAAWKLEYAINGGSQTTVPVSQLRVAETEGLIQYFRAKSSPENAIQKTEFTTGACGIKVGNIAYSQDSEFPCAAKDNFQGYASGYFIAPYTGDIKFYLSSDDSSYLTINVNGTDQNLSRPCCSESDATWSGFVKGQLYPIKVFFTEDAGLASWKLKYEYAGQVKTDIPASQLRPSAAFTAPVAGTNGVGGGGGGGSAGTFKITGAKGGSGTAILKYLTPSETATQTMITAIVNQQTPSGLLTLNVPEYVNVGVYTQTIKVQDAANSAPYQAVVTITVNKATPVIALSLPGSVTTAKYGTAVSISAQSLTAGTVNFKDGTNVISGCESVTATSGVATCSWTPSSVGSRTITAKLTPADTANYNSSADTTFGVTVGKADTLTVTATDETFDFTNSAASVTRPFLYNGLVSIDTLTAVAMLYSGTANDGTVYSSTTAPTLAGTYSITPNYSNNSMALTYGNIDTTVAGLTCRMVPPAIFECTGGTPVISDYYASVLVIPGTLRVNRISPTTTFTFANSNTVTYAPNATLAATAISRSGDGARTYSTNTPSKCSISDTPTVSVLEAGSCVVNMIVAQSANYLTKTDSATITINKASRTITLTSNVVSLKYTDTATVTTTISGGETDGTVTYGLNANPACSFDALGGVLTATAGTGTCTVTADISEGTNYLANTVAGSLSQTIAKANAPTIVIDTVTAVDYVPGVRAQISPTYTIRGFKGSDAASTLTLTYGFVSNPFETFSYSDTRTPIDAGTYSITPSAIVMSTGLLSNYETPNYSSAAINFTVNRIAQDAITIDGVNGEVSVPFTLVYRGGNNPTGTATFTKVSGAACTVTGNGLNASAAGLCVVTVSLTGNRNYLPVTSESITVRVRSYTLVPVFVFGNGTTGISISTTTPLTVGSSACTSGCTPKITAISPYEGAEGDVITLTGINFTGAVRVIFNVFTNAVTFNVDSDTQITVQIPAGLAVGDGTIEVVTSGGTTPRWFDFGVLP